MSRHLKYYFCRDKQTQLNITFDIEDNVEQVRKTNSGRVEDNNGGGESEQKVERANFGEGSGAEEGSAEGGGEESKGGGGGEGEGGLEDQGNKMSRSFMRQACHFVSWIILLLLQKKNKQTTFSQKINLNTRVAV